MLQGEHSAKLLTFIKLPFVIKTFVLSIFEWPFYTGITVYIFREIKTFVLFYFESLFYTGFTVYIKCNQAFLTVSTHCLMLPVSSVFDELFLVTTFLTVDQSDDTLITDDSKLTI